MNLFGRPKVDPIEAAKTCKRNIEREARRMDRDIAAMRNQEKKALAECKKYVKMVLSSK